MTPPTQFTNVNDALKHADSARELDLRDRNLRTLPKSIAKLTRLEVLDIADNPIRNLPDWLFELKSLRILDATSTTLEEVPAEINALAALEELYLRSNPFVQLPATLTSLSKLCMLDLSGAWQLEKLPDLSPLTALQELRLAGMRNVTNLDEALAHLPPLSTLLLDDVPLTAFPDKPGSLTNLRDLTVASTSIQQLPRWIGSLDKLERFYFEFNSQIESLPDDLGNLRALRELYIGLSRRGPTPKSGPRIIPLPRSLGKLVHLENLTLDSCNLEEIPDWVFDLTNLKTLHIGGNPLKRVSPSLAKLKALRTLYIGCKPAIYPQKEEIQSWLPECEIELTGEPRRVVTIDEIMERSPEPVAQVPAVKPRVSARNVSTTNDWPELHGIEKWVCLSDAQQRRVTEALAKRLGPKVEILEPTKINLFPRLKDPTTGIVWIAIAGEEFEMGLGTSDKQALTKLTKTWSDEAKAHVQELATIARPAHKVFVPPFLCAEMPVRAHEAQDISGVQALGAVCLFEPLAAVAHAERVGARLLSEAEWEYIARHRDSRAWISMEDDSRKHDPRKFVENAMQGGLDAETGFLFGVRGLGWGTWVEDSWHANYQGAPNDGQSWDPHEIPEVVRGGAYLSWPWQMDGEALLMHAAHRERKSKGNFPLLLAHNLPSRSIK